MNRKVDRAVTKPNFKHDGRKSQKDGPILQLLADKAFPELQEAARSQLAINSYLQQLDHLQVAFGVKQKRPKTIDEAVSATLEMESYATQPGSATTVSAVEGSESPAVVAATQLTEKLSTLVEKLTERVERLELNQVSTESYPTIMKPG